MHLIPAALFVTSMPGRQRPFAADMSTLVGGQSMYPSKDIVDNAVNRPTTRPWSPPSRRPAWSTP
jgi:hypothetical protein